MNKAPAKTKAEFEKAVPIKVELAAGVATLRQVQTTGTLVTDFDTQLIVEMVDPNGAKTDVELEAGWRPEREELLPVLEDEVREEAETGDDDAKALEEWMRLEVEAEEIEIQNYTMVETLASRQVAEVKACLARMIARLKYLGLDVRRVHSDAAGDMRGIK